jgi:phosphate transport system substrate-binding protein
MMKSRIMIATLSLCLWSATAFADDLKIVGTGEGLDIVQALGAAFMADNPDTLVIIPPSVGSDGGVTAVVSDNEILGRVARPLSLSEQAHGLSYTPVFRLSSAIYVHPSAAITSLSTDQLVDIFRGKIANWREVGGADLRIKVVRRQEDESTVIVLRETMAGWKNLRFTERSKLATTAQESLYWVSKTEGAVGIGTYSNILEARVLTMKIDGNHPTDPDYPSAITIGFIHKNSTITEEAREFLAFSVSPKAKRLISNLGGHPYSK